MMEEFPDVEKVWKDPPGCGGLVCCDKLYDEFQRNDAFENYTRLMGMPGLPITPDDVMPEDYARAIESGDEVVPDQRQHATASQLVREAEELFRRWDFSRPEELSARGIQIGISRVQGWPAGDDLAPTRRFLILDTEKCVSCEDKFEDPALYYEESEFQFEPRPFDEILEFQNSLAHSNLEVKQDGNPLHGGTFLQSESVVEDCLYEVTFYLTKEQPSRVSKSSTILDSTQVLARGYLIPEFTSLALESPARDQPSSKYGTPRSSRTADDGSPSFDGLLTPRQVERFRQPYNLDSLFRSSAGASPRPATPSTPVSPRQAPRRPSYPEPPPPPGPRWGAVPRRDWGILLSPASGGGVAVEYLVPEGPSARSGLLRVGDRIVAVDGRDVRGCSVPRVVRLLAPADRVRLSVLRWGPRGHGLVRGFVPSGPIRCSPAARD